LILKKPDQQGATSVLTFDEVFWSIKKRKPELASETSYALLNTILRIMHWRLIATQQQKYSVAKGENVLVKRLGVGWSLVQTFSDDKYLG
jgi:hypothetical protein